MPLPLAGIIPRLVTPFTGAGQDLDEPALRAEIRYLLDVGVHGLTLCGSTGEGHTLSLEETVRCAKSARRKPAGGYRSWSESIRNSTREVHPVWARAAQRRRS